jgi:hypothetical protein
MIFSPTRRPGSEPRRFAVRITDVKEKIADILNDQASQGRLEASKEALCQAIRDQCL